MCGTVDLHVALAARLALPFVAPPQTHDDALCRPPLAPRATGGPLLVLAPQTELMLPLDARKFSEATPHFPADGMLQGAALE
ncbi:MAG: hypothetical protein ABIT20_08780 [Gemmatimonadaceae bacterium]